MTCFGGSQGRDHCTAREYHGSRDHTVVDLEYPDPPGIVDLGMTAPEVCMAQIAQLSAVETADEVMESDRGHQIDSRRMVHDLPSRRVDH